MFTYLENRSLYYALFVAELLYIPLADAFKRISPIFLCDSSKRLNKLVRAKTLSTMKSCNNISVYLNFLSSFCTNERMFGMVTEECELLHLKRDVLQLVEELKSAPLHNEMIVLSERYRELELSTAFALVLYTRSEQAQSQLLPILRKALHDTDGLDATLALLFFETQENKQDCLALLSKSKAIALYPELIPAFADRYGLEQKAISKHDFWEVK